MPDVTFAELGRLLEKYRHDPKGLEINRRIGLIMMSVRKTQLDAEPYIRRALAHGVWDDDAARLLDGLGHIHLLKGEPEKAAEVYALAHRQYPAVIDFVFRLGDVLFRLGRYEESSTAYHAGIDRLYANARDNAREAGAPLVHLLSPATVICRYFGEMAAKIDLYLKVRELGLIDRAEPVLLAPAEEIVNQSLLDCWGPNVRVVSDPASIDEMRATRGASMVFCDYYTLPDGRTLHRDVAHRAVQGLWEADGRGPLLTLSEDHARRGRAVLAGLGVPEDAWFVALHVRDAGFFDEDRRWNHNRHRNADIETYLPAIEAITDRGGWVVRLGDPTMTRLPAMNRVIDYALSDVRADWIDVYLIAAARFYLGMASGPSSTAVAFGVPTLGTNWFPLGPWPYCRGDIFLPKLICRRGDGRLLGIAEALAPPLFAAMEPAFFDRHGLDVVDNTPEDIADATREMLDALDGRATYSAEDERRQSAFRAVADPMNVGLAPRVARDFLARHPELIGGS